MIVLDASAVLDLLLRTERAESIAALVFSPDQRLHAPHLLDIEVTQVLRRLVQHKSLAASRARTALTDYADLSIERHDQTLLLPRIFDLRDSLTAYDGVYIALAEVLDAPLLTCDARLARSHGHRATVTLIAVGATDS